MEWSVLSQYGPALLSGFGVTIFCWLMGTALGAALGLMIALAQRYGPAPLRWLLQVYIEIIRGTPFMVQLFVLYYGGPLVGLRLDALPAGLLGLSVYGSPYFAEIFRSGFNAVPRGQIEAARSTGLTRGQTMTYVVLPQAVRNVLPDLISNTLEVVKLTSIASVVALPELLFQARQAQSVTYNATPIMAAAVIYFILLWPVVRMLSRLENRQLAGRR